MCASSPGAITIGLGDIDDIEPLHVAAYIEALQADFEKPSIKQHLAAVRMLFDWLVTGQVVRMSAITPSAQSASRLSECRRHAAERAGHGGA